jgi:RNA polymerase sigma-70 factor (ECF subfamily)
LSVSGAPLHRELVEALFARYRTPVYRFLCRLTRDRAAAEDLTQDLFVRALGAAYQAGEHERAWVFQIARNLARDHARRMVHRRPSAALADEPSAFLDRASALAVQDAIARLPDLDREMFLLREVAGLTYDEIAIACDVTSDAVRNRLHRARLSLRETLAPPIVQLNRARS